MSDEIVGLNYVSLYIKDFEKAIEYYSQIFGPPTYARACGKIVFSRMGR